GEVVRLFFFFQAEDGIRDWSVTGVQTCALPISTGPRSRRSRAQRQALRGLDREATGRMRRERPTGFGPGDRPARRPPRPRGRRRRRAPAAPAARVPGSPIAAASTPRPALAALD